MISFRFHVVSITAVFLAIAIGVVVGSTYVDRAIVDNLQHRIDTVSANLDDRKAANDALDRELRDTKAFVGASLDFAVTDRLTDVPVFVAATRGVDEDAAKQIVRLSRRAGGIVPGVVWLEPKWGLQGDGDQAELAGIVGASTSASPEALWREAWRAIAKELSPVAGVSDQLPEVGASTTTAPLGGPAASVLRDLVDAGYLSLDSVDDDSTGLADLAGRGARVVVITGAATTPELVPLVPVAVAEPLGANLAVVVADVYVKRTDGPDRGQAITDALPNEVRGAIGLVDDADLPEGQVAAVLALDLVADGVVGHYGYGSGADGILPVWSPP
jgi:hypothetical protein